MDNLITLYQQRLNLQDSTFSRIEHEDAMVAIVYKVTQPNGAQLILKIGLQDAQVLQKMILSLWNMRNGPQILHPKSSF